MARERERDSKYVRLTGMWPTKKDGLFTGKMRTEDIGKLIEKADEAEKDGQQLVFFLWENDKKTRKDPEFTLQVAIAEEQEGGRSSGRSSRGRDRGRDDNRDNDRNNDRDNDKGTDRDDKKDPEPEPTHSRSSKKDEPKGRSGKRTDKKDDNW